MIFFHPQLPEHSKLIRGASNQASQKIFINTWELHVKQSAKIYGVRRLRGGGGGGDGKRRRRERAAQRSAAQGYQGHFFLHLLLLRRRRRRRRRCCPRCRQGSELVRATGWDGGGEPFLNRERKKERKKEREGEKKAAIRVFFLLQERAPPRLCSTQQGKKDGK